MLFSVKKIRSFTGYFSVEALSMISHAASSIFMNWIYGMMILFSPAAARLHRVAFSFKTSFSQIV